MDGIRKRLAERPVQTALAAGGAIGFALLFYALVQPMTAGILYDDGIYIMGALSMSAGKGYMLPWVEGTPDVYKYPPLFPAILSIPVLFFQSFQGKIAAFLSVNLLFSLVALGLIFRLYRQYYGFSSVLAAGLLVMIATSWRFLEPATAVMTEPLYLLLTAGLFLAYQRRQESGEPGRLCWPVILLGLLAFYTRTIGVLALGAVVLHQLWQRRFKSAALYAASFAAGAFPWLWWSVQQATSPHEIGGFLVRTFQENYTLTLKLDLLYEHDLFPLYGEGFSELVSNMAWSIFPWLENYPFGESIALFPNLVLSGLLLVWLARCLIKKEFSLIGIYLSLYLLALPMWSFHSQYPRFLAVLLPFLLSQFVLLARNHLAEPRLREMIPAMILAWGIATNVLVVWDRIEQDNRGILNDYHFVFEYIQHNTEPDDAVWTDNTMDSMYLGLWTRRPALDFFVFYPGMLSADMPSEEFAPLFRRKADVIYRLLSGNRVRYVVINHALLTRNQIQAGHVIDRDDPATRFLMQDHAEAFEKVADSPNGFMTVYRTRFASEAPSIPE